MDYINKIIKKKIDFDRDVIFSFFCFILKARSLEQL